MMCSYQGREGAICAVPPMGSEILQKFGQKGVKMGQNEQKTSANPWVGNLMMRSYGPRLWMIGDGLPMPVGGVGNQKIEGHIRVLHQGDST